MFKKLFLLSLFFIILLHFNPTLAHDLFKKIRELRDSLNITFILIEHRLEIALKYVDYVFAMDKGKILTEGKPKKVISDPKVIESYLGA